MLLEMKGDFHKNRVQLNQPLGNNDIDLICHILMIKKGDKPDCVFPVQFRFREHIQTDGKMSSALMKNL